MSGNSGKLPIKHDERAYASFTRQLAHQDDRPTPEPLPPDERVTRDALATLAEVMDRLIATDVAVPGHLPEAVRLKLSRLILSAAEKTEAAHAAFACYARRNTLSSPSTHRHHKRRSRPR